MNATTWAPATLVRFLLGDPQREVSVPKWVEALEDEKHRGMDVTGTGLRHPWISSFELACAYLYDARPSRAQEIFQLLAATASSGEGSRVLAVVGQARALSALRRYRRSDKHLQEALASATRLGDPVLMSMARFSLIGNRSDGAMDASSEAIEAPLNDALLENVWAPLEAFRIHALSRVLLRSGERRKGIAAIEPFIADPRFQALAPILRGQIFRMRGILYSMSGETSSALADLEHAIGVFRGVSFYLGEVQAALSLAKINVRTDRQNTSRYLERAKDIVEATDPPDAHSPRNRQMIAERAVLYGRLGDYHFARGDLDEARTSYEKDLAVTQSQSDPASPLRALGYAHRNLGRVLLAQRQLEDAAGHLRESSRVFDKAGDHMNVFFSESLLCEALLLSDEYSQAGSVLTRLEGLLGDRIDRAKERAIIHMFRGALEWRSEKRVSSLHAVQVAKTALRASGIDYYYARALLVEAEILIQQEDVLEARDVLLEARRCSLDYELEDIRRESEAMLGRIGVRRADYVDRVDLEIRCSEKSARVDLTILYGDLRGFSRLCTLIEPVTMAEFIKEFAEILGKAISRNGGLATRFLGDCVMALFGVRNDPEDKEIKCAAATADAYALFSQLRARWGAAVPELANVGIGFGVATGPVVAGRFGNAERSEFSVVGEAANLASRLQGHANDGEIAMCSVTARALIARLPDLPVSEQTVDLKGIGRSTLNMSDVRRLSRSLTASRAAAAAGVDSWTSAQLRQAR